MSCRNSSSTPTRKPRNKNRRSCGATIAAGFSRRDLNRFYRSCCAAINTRVSQTRRSVAIDSRQSASVRLSGVRGEPSRRVDDEHPVRLQHRSGCDPEFRPAQLSAVRDCAPDGRRIRVQSSRTNPSRLGLRRLRSPVRDLNRAAARLTAGPRERFQSFLWVCYFSFTKFGVFDRAGLWRRSGTSVK
jgi:hypothetical protein